jgi:hypothetical protein
LDLWLKLDKGQLVIFDARTGEPLPTEAEAERAAREAERAAREAAEARAAAAEDELRRLREQLKGGGLTE